MNFKLISNQLKELRIELLHEIRKVSEDANDHPPILRTG